MKQKRAIVWFRNDLRLHDNEALMEAIKNAGEIIPVYVFDERIFMGKTSFGFQKTGAFRAKFIIESVEDLRHSLRTRGSELIVNIGKPEVFLSDLARQTKASWVFCNRERTREEIEVQDKLEKNLWAVGAEVRYTRGKMLYHTQDLPVPVNQTPDIFTNFRKEVERTTIVRKPLDAPARVPAPTMHIDAGAMPNIKQFGHKLIENDPRAALAFKGGETQALERLRYYLWESNRILTYKETRNELIGSDYSTKFSAWLAAGCISPKMIYHEIKKYECEKKANESTYWVYFELLWRDYFRLMGKKYGNKIFQHGGTLEKKNLELQNNLPIFEKWATGNTGVPFIDANMRELAATGFMSNRGRQNVASFLVKDLKINWIMGAEWFESLLVDYDPCSNYGNWNYVAGVGSDPRENRYFNILSQAQRYDANGDFVKHWCPELSKVPAEKINRPDALNAAEQKKYNVKIGEQYPIAVVETAKWL